MKRKKILLGVGSLLVGTLPITAAISCGRISGSDINQYVFQKMDFDYDKGVKITRGSILIKYNEISSIETDTSESDSTDGNGYQYIIEIFYKNGRQTKIWFLNNDDIDLNRQLNEQSGYTYHKLSESFICSCDENIETFLTDSSEYNKFLNWWWKN